MLTLPVSLPRYRVRGYQFKSEFAQQKKNPRVYGLLDEQAEKAANSETQTPSATATPDTDAEGLQAHGFAEREK